MIKLFITLALVTVMTILAYGCGIDAQVEPVISVVPNNAITLEAAGCTCANLPPEYSFLLIPVITGSVEEAEKLKEEQCKPNGK